MEDAPSFGGGSGASPMTDKGYSDVPIFILRISLIPVSSTNFTHIVPVGYSDFVFFLKRVYYGFASCKN